MAKRQIECPFCTGEVLSEQNGRAARSASLWPKFQNIVFAISDILSLITGNTKTVSRRQAIGGRCEACNNRGTIDDPSDSTDAEQAAGRILEANKDYLDQELGKLGGSPGGSRLTRIAGADVLLVGHVLNKAESVGVRDDAPGPGGGTVGKDTGGEGRGGLPNGVKGYPATKALNPPANSGGGQYVIQCGNKFDLIAGAQGANINTYGVLNLHGKAGVQITGAEVTVGTGVGQTAIGGKHINMEGEFVSIGATGKTGHVNITGSLQATGSVQANGAYFDNIYFAKGTCPSKQVPVKGGSTTAIQTGPAIWGGTNTAALKAAFTQLQKHIQERTLDYDLFKAGGPTTPRFFLNLNDLVYGLSYAGMPFEPKLTGLCFVGIPGIGTVVGTVFNFPHTHAIHDGLHNHQVEVPAINTEGYTSATQVRLAANAANINGKEGVAGAAGENIIARLWQSGGSAYAAFGGQSTTKSSHSTITTG